jgi:predicted phosphodiesterase
MRAWLQKILTPFVKKLALKYDGNPDKERIFEQLTNLYQNITGNPGKKGLILPFDSTHKFIILSDQHKGAKDNSDDFELAENNYLTALQYYFQEGYYLICLGDSEELWENTLLQIIKNNQASFKAEKQFVQANKFIKIFGNHDLYWDNDPLAAISLLTIYGQAVTIYEGLILQSTNLQQPLSLFLTHGHQGDLQSDGNWFSKWFVSTIWAPLQSFLKINLNTPANNDFLKTLHNTIMYQWSAEQKNVILITGHTHQPVFASLTHIENLYQRLSVANKNNQTAIAHQLQTQIEKLAINGVIVPDFAAYKPTYFNSGCCCFDDGDITGIEIEGGMIRLIKWQYNAALQSEKSVLEEANL